jgi:hypothetical protein
MSNKKKKEPSREPECIEHTFPLRPDLLMTFELPRDLTAKEAARIGKWLATLPDDAE